MNGRELAENREEIAIIGMAGRFPGARSIEEFWRNLREGVNSIKAFTVEESIASGVRPDLLKNPKFVNMHGALEDGDSFDAKFFGISPKEAEMMDPQHRLFLECAWAAIENAGYDPERYDGLIGVFGGVARNTYFIYNMAAYRELMDSGALYETMLGSEKDYPATRVSYKLNLRGPSINVQTACSTSGVAIHLACQSLLNGECDIAIAGGGRVQVPLKGGYLYVEGGITSPDGHCRAFDEKAQGTVYGSGLGMIVLKRLSEAVQDGDDIQAVIKGSAVNNDGSDKVGFTAPSIKGQAAVIEEALGVAGVDADTIGYVETHGTGTALGDPIEIAGLTKAFRKSTKRKGFCAIGSVKTNIGHLDAGACVASVIKTVLVLKNRLIPPSLDFERPNPQIDFASSPFYVNTELREWRSDATPRRAGVSSFGLGGTNAHIILEEAPEIQPSGPSRPYQLLLLSAKTAAALDMATKNLVNHLRHHPELNLADVAYTLQIGRRSFEHRRAIVCQDRDDAVTALETLDPKRVLTSFQEPITRGVVFIFSGQGSQYVNMGLELYRSESVFREEIDRCSEILQPLLSLDLRDILYPGADDIDSATKKLTQTSITQPALFAVEYALAKLWMSWGVHQEAMVGHSIGEYVAACLAGVFSLENALSLVASRGRLMQGLPAGLMLAVPLSEKEVEPFLCEKLSVAVVNGPSLCVISGEKEAVEDLERQLSERKMHCRRLHTSHAFHSKMMEPILDLFNEQVGKAKRNPPQIPFLSNLTGTWITPDEAVDPNYWTRHLRQTVRFSDCLQELFREPHRVFLEVGPGCTFSTLAMQHPNKKKEQVVLASTPHPQEKKSDVAFILETMGRLWLAGIQIDWFGFYSDEIRHRIPLPTYPFERKRYWLSAKQRFAALEALPLSDEQEKPLPSDQTNNKVKYLYEGAPRDDREQSVAKIWQEVLGVENVRIHDNFFDLGGNSLLALQIFTQIEHVFKRKLPLATIIEAPTIEQLAGILREEESKAPWASLVKIQAGNSKPPFFCVHAHGGNVVGYYDLARHLGPDQPFYGLQARGLDGKQVSEPKIAEMAAHYIKEILTVQPKGPYYLGGFCFGGIVAFEIAQQLKAQGEEIALLAMIQSHHPDYPKLLPSTTFFHRRIFSVIDRFNFEMGNLRPIGLKMKLSYISKKIRRVITKMQFLTANVTEPIFAKLHLKISHSIAYSLIALEEAHDKAFKSYKPQPYQGQATLFRASKQPLGIYPDPKLGLGDLIKGGVEVYEIPGHHLNIFESPNSVKALAEKLRVSLDKAQRENKLTSHSLPLPSKGRGEG